MQENIREEIRFNERARRNIAILETIRKTGPMTKAEISNNIGLNVVTVTNYINHFISQDIVFEKELDISQGGRRPVILDINKDARYAIGIGVNVHNMVGVLINMAGDVLCEVRRTPNMEIKDIINALRDIIKEIKESFKGDFSKVSGIGVAIGGLVDDITGSIKWPERIGEGQYDYVSIYVPLREYLERDFSLPVILENDATASAFGEYWYYIDPKVENLVYMFSAVGSGLILGGELYRGSSGCAGELSLIPSPMLTQGGNSGCDILKRTNSDLDIVSTLKTILKKGRDDVSILTKLANGNVNNINFDMVVSAIKEGDSVVREVVKEKAKILGFKVAFLINLLNPQIVIIGGGIERLGNDLIDTVKTCVDSLCFDEISSVAKIMPSRLGDRAAALGVASLVMRKVFAQL